MKRHLFLIFWTLGILFPMGWFVRTSPVGYRLFNTMFSPAWTHIFMHSLLFAVLGALLMQSMYGRLAARVASPSFWRCCSASGSFRRAFSCSASNAY